MLVLEYLRDVLGRWLLNKPTREDERYIEFRNAEFEFSRMRTSMIAQHKAERLEQQRQFREDLEKEREAQRALMLQTMEVMANLVNSVKSSNDLLANYLGMFTSAGKPQIRTMSEADLAIREAEVIKDQPISKRKEVHPQDPFNWMGDRPDLFEGKAEELSSIKDSLAL